MNPRLEVGVAGAGVAGLAAGALLARAGHRVTIHDQFETPAPVGSGLMIQPVGAEILDILGAGSSFRAHAAPIRRIVGRRAGDGGTVLDVSYDRLGAGTHGLACQRTTLFEVLLEAAKAAGVTLVTGVTVTGADGAPRPNLFAGADRFGSFDLVVDALGQRSPLCPRPGRLLPYGALWTLLDPAETGFAPDRLEQRYTGAHRMVGVLPVGSRPGEATPKVTFFWSLRGDGYEAWRAAPLADWKAAVRDDWPETAPLLDTIGTHDALTFARYRHRTLSHPVTGRIAHLGDSFHAASPQLGQGANMALLDATALASALAGARHLDHALAEYARLRRLHVGLYTAASWAFTPLYQSDSTILPWLRDRVLWPLGQVPPVPRLLSNLVAGEVGWPRRGLHDTRTR